METARTPDQRFTAQARRLKSPVIVTFGVLARGPISIHLEDPFASRAKALGDIHPRDPFDDWAVNARGRQTSEEEE